MRNHLFGKHFLIDFYSGLGLNINKTEAKLAATNTIYDEVNSGGIDIRLNLALGWRF